MFFGDVTCPQFPVSERKGDVWGRNARWNSMWSDTTATVFLRKTERER